MVVDVRPVPIETLDDAGMAFGELVASALAETFGQALRDSPDTLVAAGWRDYVTRALTPSDLAAFPSLWRRRVSALVAPVWNMFGRSATSSRTQSVPAVSPPQAWMDRVTSGPDALSAAQAQALWREQVTAGMPLVSPEAAQPVMDETTVALTAVGDDLWGRALEEIAISSAEGESADQLADRLATALDISQNRARAIARSEMTRSANAASLAQMMAASLYGIKVWQAVHDDRTRPAHVEADSQERPVADTFDVGGSPMRYPGDPRAPIALWVNCRCDMSYRLPETQTPQWALDIAAGGRALSADQPSWPPYEPSQELTTVASLDPAVSEELQSDMPPQLKLYWLTGEGALKIRWGTPGAFDRCVSALRGDFPQNPEGLCANLYHEATGRWPGEGRGQESLADIPTQLPIDVEDDIEDECPDPEDDGEWEWERQLAVEGTPSGDGRMFLPGSLTMESLPIPFAWQRFTSDGHDNSSVVGRIDEIWRDGSVIMGRGVIGLDSQDGRDAARGMCREYQRGISIDADMIAGEVTEDEFGDQTEVYSSGRIRGATIVMTPAFTDGETMDIPTLTAAAIRSHDTPTTDIPWDGAANEKRLPSPMTVDTARNVYAWMDDDAITDGMVVKAACKFPHHEVSADGTPGAANLAACSAGIAALNGARGGTDIPGDSVQGVYDHLARHLRDAEREPPPLTASASCGCETSTESDDHVIVIPRVPPADWFTEPVDVEMHGALTVTDRGRVYGYLAPDNVAHRSYSDTDVYVPRNVDYSAYLGAETIVAGGGRVVTGPITMGCGHAGTHRSIGAEAAMEHYDNTCSVVANISVGENRHGVWVAGALVPGVGPDQVVRMMGCRLSGDWRPHRTQPGKRELTAALLVPTPGFADSRKRASVTVEEGAMVASSVPVEFLITGPTVVNPLTSVMASLRRRIGRDPASLLRAQIERVHGRD